MLLLSNWNTPTGLTLQPILWCCSLWLKLKSRIKYIVDSFATLKHCSDAFVFYFWFRRMYNRRVKKIIVARRTWRKNQPLVLSLLNSHYICTHVSSREKLHFSNHFLPEAVLTASNNEKIKSHWHASELPFNDIIARANFKLERFFLLANFRMCFIGGRRSEIRQRVLFGFDVTKRQRSVQQWSLTMKVWMLTRNPCMLTVGLLITEGNQTDSAKEMWPCCKTQFALHGPTQNGNLHRQTCKDLVRQKSPPGSECRRLSLRWWKSVALLLCKCNSSNLPHIP